jgi:CMP-N-acetylneuraminic acid synthetase
MKIVAMIPARLGSKRIKQKNLRLLDGKPLVSHVLDKCKDADIFSEIYINSESGIFKSVADEYGVKLYIRDPIFATDDATNDQFILDFINHIDCDIVVQVNPTSPLVQAEEIKSFVTEMLQGDFDTMLSVKREQVEGFYKGKPINFDQLDQMPRSQDLEPIYLHCSTILAWKSKVIREKMDKYNCCTYGADSKVGYYTFDSYANIDIDNEADFIFAETIIQYLKKPKDVVKKYYSIDK